MVPYVSYGLSRLAFKEDPPTPSDHGGQTPDPYEDDPYHSDNEGENLVDTIYGRNDIYIYCIVFRDWGF
jgi:hypothetical protein